MEFKHVMAFIAIYEESRINRGTQWLRNVELTEAGGTLP